MVDDNLEPSPGSMFMEAVREFAGEEGVRAVQAARGGTQISLPIKIRTADHWLARCLGLEAANKACAAMCVINADGKPVGRLRLAIPLGEHGLIQRALLEAERLIREGRSGRAIAIEIGLSERAIWRLKAKLVASGELRRAP